MPSVDTASRILQVLRRRKSRPLMIKELAKLVGVSENTAGKYVAILVERGQVYTDRYASAKQVHLGRKP